MRRDSPPPPCNGESELFDSIDHFDHLAAKAICNTCPLFDACMAHLAVVLASKEHEGNAPEGTWAGQLFLPRPRARTYREIDLGEYEDCGTENAYKRHVADGQATCIACRKAHASYERHKKAQRRRKAAS